MSSNLLFYFRRILMHPSHYSTVINLNASFYHHFVSSSNLMGFQSKEKYNSCSTNPYSYFGEKMELGALEQLLASLNLNPDEIEDKKYATSFRILFSITEKQNEKIEFLKAENQKLRDEINLLSTRCG